MDALGKVLASFNLERGFYATREYSFNQRHYDGSTDWKSISIMVEKNTGIAFIPAPGIPTRPRILEGQFR